MVDWKSENYQVVIKLVSETENTSVKPKNRTISRVCMMDGIFEFQLDISNMITTFKNKHARRIVDVHLQKLFKISFFNNSGCIISSADIKLLSQDNV